MSPLDPHDWQRRCEARHDRDDERERDALGRIAVLEQRSDEDRERFKAGAQTFGDLRDSIAAVAEQASPKPWKWVALAAGLLVPAIGLIAWLATLPTRDDYEATSGSIRVIEVRQAEQAIDIRQIKHDVEASEKSSQRINEKLDHVIRVLPGRGMSR